MHKTISKNNSKAPYNFPYKAPKEYLAKISRFNKNDPLFLQITPTEAEQKRSTNFSYDPLCEKQYMPIPGLLHKYHGRVLILATLNCAIHCRFCFRRFMHDIVINWQKIFAYIAKDKTITEVILSGGDPLTLSNKKLAMIFNNLVKITHVRSLRIHTRVPIVKPKRITNALITTLRATKLSIVIVTHCNHANEIGNTERVAIKKLRNAGFFVLNQAVLLKGVNDSAATLITLSETLFTAGIIPYYLHLLDKVQGTQHFAVDRKAAKQFHKIITEQLPGYLVPKLVYEKSGAKAKIAI
jgi:L-lysine 2,3-aminomutase